MAPDQDQYVHFTIKLLKGSFALNALWQDALNYHMIDHPDKLIALRLTEYYEMISRGSTRPGNGVQNMQATPVTPVAHMSNKAHPTSPLIASPTNGMAPAQTSNQQLEPAKDIVVSSPAPVVEQNAEEAADYWTPM